MNPVGDELGRCTDGVQVSMSKYDSDSDSDSNPDPVTVHKTVSLVPGRVATGVRICRTA
jgi:hypothetical protein